MNSKLAKKFRKLLALRTAPVAEYMQHSKNGMIIVDPNSVKGTYKRIKKARLTAKVLKDKMILGTQYV